MKKIQTPVPEGEGQGWGQFLQLHLIKKKKSIFSVILWPFAGLFVYLRHTCNEKYK